MPTPSKRIPLAGKITRATAYVNEYGYRNHHSHTVVETTRIVVETVEGPCWCGNAPKGEKVSEGDLVLMTIIPTGEKNKYGSSMFTHAKMMSLITK